MLKLLLHRSSGWLSYPILQPSNSDTTTTNVFSDTVTIIWWSVHCSYRKPIVNDS